MQKLFDLFETMGYKEAEGFFRQGSLSDENYPEKFFTFWNIDTPSDSFYDNEEARYNEYIQVGFYTNDAKLIYSEMEDFIERARAKGFSCTRAKDAPSGKANYYGRICYVRIINKN